MTKEAMTRMMNRIVSIAMVCMCMCMVLGAKAKAQTAVYGEFSASRLTGSPEGDFLYGGTAGIVIQAAAYGPHVRLLGDVQGQFVQKNGEKLNGITLGPRVAFPVARLHGITPYADFLVGFARYNDATHNGPTDAIFQTNAGLTKQVSKRWDLVAEYSWAHYGAFFNQYDPQTFSAGAMFYFSR